MPMLDEGEFAEISQLFQCGMRATKEFRERWGIPLESVSIRERFLPVRLRYEKMTGLKDCHENAILHHQISMYGPLCARCGKPLRTPQAKLCGACMFPVHSS
jgi:hypothetical protein